MAGDGESVSQSKNAPRDDAAIADLKPVESFAIYICGAIFLLIVLHSVSLGLRWSSPADALLTLVVSLAVVAASSAVGSLLGFLFGIPRYLQRAAPAIRKPDDPDASAGQNAQAARAFAGNTSLEEISDWLTKIIIGVGLVQFQTIVAYLYKCALFAGSHVAFASIPGSADVSTLEYDPAVASPYFFALIVAALIGSCLFAYLETRTRLTLIFVTTEKVQDGSARALDVSAKKGVPTPEGLIEMTAARGPAPPAAKRPAATSDDKKILDIPRESLRGAKELVGWASAQARNGHYQVAEDALRDALQNDPSNN
jgi:hypothetical protein